MELRHRSSGRKRDEIKSAPEGCLAFTDNRSHTYLNITGRAEMTHDVAKAKELWSTEAQAWWPNGQADPDVRVA